MFHSVGILWPSGVLFRTDEPPHWVHSAFDLPDLELGIDRAKSAANVYPQFKLQLEITKATIVSFFMLSLERYLRQSTQRIRRERRKTIRSLCSLCPLWFKND